MTAAGPQHDDPAARCARPDPPGPPERPSRWWLALIGLPIGFASSLCGIGGGLFAGPLLHLGFRFELRRATGTALVLVLATTGAATAVELTRDDSALRLATWAAVVVGVWTGAKAGFRFSERVPDRTLRAIFCVVLLSAALRTYFVQSGDVRPAPGGERALLDAAIGFAVGLGGGFVAPLLGVGGGLIMVPGLFLLVPGLGFDAARATSLAAGLVGALRSLRLKAGAGRVGWRHGGLLALGALLGAAAGVLALDATVALVDAGRRLLALVLLVVGVRFGRDFLRTRA